MHKKSILSVVLVFIFFMSNLSSSCFAKKIGWVYKNGEKYKYIQTDGSYATGVTNIDGEYYFFYKDGSILKKGYGKKVSKGKTYYYYFTPKAVKGAYKINGKVYYFNEKYGYRETGAKQINGKYFYFNPEMKTGIQEVNGNFYYYGTGAMQTGAKKIEGKYYYFYPEMKFGLQKVNGKTYYYGVSGAMETGPKKIDGKYYYFYPEMKFGLQKVNGKNYYYGTTGVMETGLKTFEKTQYYFYPEMKSGVWRVNGERVMFFVKDFPSGTIDDDSFVGEDFILDFPEGKDITILQLADLQMTKLDYGESCRNTSYTAPMGTDSTNILWNHVDKAVKAANPDIILLSGDNVEGIFDDNGKDWLELCNKIDSYGIPWIVIFGNHDLESEKGAAWMIKQVQNTRYGMIERGNCTGNSNFSVLLTQGGKEKYVIWAVDTNGTYYKNVSPNISEEERAKIRMSAGVFDDQVLWMNETSAAINEKAGKNVPSLIFMHIPPGELTEIMEAKYGDTFRTTPFYPTASGDYGVAYEVPFGCMNKNISGGMFNLVRNLNCKAMFFGHQHEVAISIKYDNVRYSWGLKTGNYSYMDSRTIGATKIVIDGDSDNVSVTYLR